MNHHPDQGKILWMNMGAHAILHLAFYFQLCGFDTTNPYWYRRTSQKRISTSHVLRRSCSEMPHAYKWVPCPWIGLLILLADSILPDPPFLLMFPATNNNSVLFQLLYTPAGDRILFKHNRRYYNVLQGGMDVAPSFPKACAVLLGTPGAWWDLFFPDKGTENSNSNISKDSWTATTLVSSKCVERTIQVLAPRFRLFGAFYLTMRMREDRLSAFTGTFYLKKLLFHM